MNNHIVFSRTNTSALSAVCSFFLDLLFPISCVGCAKPETWLCTTCYGKIKRVSRIKRIHNFNNFSHVYHNNPSHDLQIFTAINYNGSLIKKIIHNLKYNFVSALSEPCANLIIEMILANSVLPASSVSSSVIIPVPLHNRRMKERGFNQSELIARYVADFFHCILDTHSLIRTRSTGFQMKLSRNERLQNMQNAFQYVGASLSGKTVFLIDDVFTTGATFKDCARALQSAHPTNIICLALAHHFDTR